MTKTSWTERETNQEILKEMEEQKSRRVIERSKNKTFWPHNRTKNNFIKNILEGKVWVSLDKNGRSNGIFF